MILEGKYKYVLKTHIDKDYIHNHIIFNSINVDEVKVYHSYYGFYVNVKTKMSRFSKNIIYLSSTKENKKKSTRLSEENL